jgi:hypothetical protein
LAVRTFAACVALLVLPSACGGSGGAGENESSAPTQSVATATVATTTTTVAPERFGYIRSVSTAGPAATLAFDEAEFLTDKEAQKAAEEDGAVPSGQPVPNDYYIRNPHKSTKTYPIANDAQITSKRCPLCRNGKPGELEPFLASFMRSGQTYADPYRGKDSLYWLTIEDGRVVAIDEQYVP